MEVNTSFQILVAILSLVLLVFLILSIVVLVKVIQVMDHVKRITVKAEAVVDKAEAAATLLSGVQGPMGLLRLVGNIVEHFKEAKKRGKQHGEKD